MRLWWHLEEPAVSVTPMPPSMVVLIKDSLAKPTGILDSQGRMILVEERMDQIGFVRRDDEISREI